MNLCIKSTLVAALLGLAAFGVSCDEEDESGLIKPVSWMEACVDLGVAIDAKCGDGSVDVCGDPSALVACMDPDMVEEADFQACKMNIDNAADCEAAGNVSCSIACTER